MPKAAQHALVWSPAQQTYLLQTAGDNASQVQADEAAWLTWLANQRAFSFRGQQGQINLLKESRKSGDSDRLADFDLCDLPVYCRPWPGSVE